MSEGAKAVSVNLDLLLECSVVGTETWYWIHRASEQTEHVDAFAVRIRLLQSHA